MRKQYIRKPNLKKTIGIKILLVLMVFLSFSLIFFLNINHIGEINNYNENDGSLIRPSALIGEINLTNSEVDGNRYYHGDTFTLEGTLDFFDPGKSEEGYVIAVEIDDQINNLYNATTESDGTFQIDYTVSNSLNIYISHQVKAQVISDISGSVNCINQFIINVSATSYFEIGSQNQPYFAGEGSFNPNAYLRYDNGSGISNVDINYQWKNSTDLWPESLGSTDSTGFLTSFEVPSNMSTGYYDLRLNFTTLPNKIEGSETIISDIPIFSNISIEWNTPDKPYEGETITIKGQLYAKDDPTFKIYNRKVNIYYRASLIGTDTTDLNGNFSFSYTIPAGTGLRNIRVKLSENDMASIYTVNVTTSSSTDPVIPPINVSPEQLFLVIGVPIIITASVILAIGGYLVLKKKTLESKVINVPLENKIKNLKLLKESGRIEEALSYLFSVIYMELISAKYGRKRQDNETIREFGIISVKEFGLDPAKVYPFIQKIEKFIYSRTFQVSEKEFRNTIELFSPVYYQLTGTTFILNF